jgi:hypothetical protein
LVYSNRDVCSWPSPAILTSAFRGPHTPTLSLHVVLLSFCTISILTYEAQSLDPAERALPRHWLVIYSTSSSLQRLPLFFPVRFYEQPLQGISNGSDWLCSDSSGSSLKKNPFSILDLSLQRFQEMMELILQYKMFKVKITQSNNKQR